MKQDVSKVMELRHGVEADRAFIMATWLRGLYYGNSWFREIDKNSFMKHYHEIVSDILKTQTTFVQVAVLKEDKDVILGYSVLSFAYKNPVLHWVFVKDGWRRLGIATQLVPKEADTATHLTALGRKLKPVSMSFNPFLI